MSAGCVFLLTDYGYGDELAGVLRAAVVSAAPAAPVVDLTHGIAPFDVVGGARALARSVAYLGPGVVVGVVDPGVGTSRRAVAVEVASSPAYLVGPDNGLLMGALDVLGGPRRAVELRRPEQVSARTFDGRDIFAPAAAALWSGAALADVGRVIDVDSLVGLPDPVLQVGRGELRAEVTWVDRFGNVQLAARLSDAEAAGLGADGAAVTVVNGDTRQQAIRVSSFTGAGAGLGLLVDANGHLALVLDQASAAQLLDVRVGDLLDLLGSSGRAAGEDVGAAGEMPI